MTFAAPIFLLALALVPLALLGYVLLQRRRPRYALRFTNLDLLASVAAETPGRRRHLPPALFLLALAALAVALARPQLTVDVAREQASVVLAIDTSGSMDATDVDPTRLHAAREAAATFLDEVPDDLSVGLVAFSTRPAVLAVPTPDHEEIRGALEDLHAEGGTAIGDAIVQAVELAPESEGEESRDADDGPPLVVLLLSDGAPSRNTLDPEEAARTAADAGVPVYTVALGTDEGEVEQRDGFGNTVTIPVPPDRDTLREIAETTGGEFFDAPSEEAVRSVYERLGSQLGFEQEQREVTSAFAGAGLVLVLLAGALSALWFNRLP